MDQKVSTMNLTESVIGRKSVLLPIPEEEEGEKLYNSKSVFLPIEEEDSEKLFHNGAEVVDFYKDKKKKSRSKAFLRTPVSKKPHMCSDEEAKYVRQCELDGVTMPLHLGNNVDDVKVILQPMDADEELVKVPIGNEKSLERVIQKASKLLAQYKGFGTRDVSSVKCWLVDRIYHCPLLQSKPEQSETFVDNMTVLAPHVGIVYRYFEAFGLCSRKSQSNERFSVSQCNAIFQPRENLCYRGPSENLENKLVAVKKFKVALADVSIATVRAIHSTLIFAKTFELETLNDSEKLKKSTITFLCTNLEIFSLKTLISALRHGAQLTWIDTDVTTDYQGTINVPILEQKIKDAGYQCIDHSCGKNMVRMAPVECNMRGNEITTSAKFYAKDWETMTSSFARSDEIGIKLHYLLNPTTKILKKSFRDFYNEGITRYETTHSVVHSDFVPSLDDLLEIHRKYCFLKQETLVKNSIRSKLRELEKCTTATFATYFPQMQTIKKQELKKGTITTKDANKQPEGCVIHYYNSDTGKFIGNFVHSQLKRYGSVMTDGFKLMCQNVTWGSLCRENPFLAVCVAGPGLCMRKGELLPQGHHNIERNLYFRIFRAVIINNDPTNHNTQRMWMAGSTGLYTGQGSLRNAVTDMNQIGVDVYLLESLRISILDEKYEPKYGDETVGSRVIHLIPVSDMPVSQQVTLGPINATTDVMVEISDTLADVSESETLLSMLDTGIASETSSDIRRKVAGVQDRYANLGSLPTSKTPVTNYKFITSSGRGYKGEKKQGKTIVIEAGGDRYKIPDYLSSGLYEAIRNKEIKQLFYIWQEQETSTGKPSHMKVRWELEVNQERSLLVDNVKIQKVAAIPVGECMNIVQFGIVPHSKGGTQMFVRVWNGDKKYFLPYVIKAQVDDFLVTKGLSLPELTGWTLTRTSDGLIKTIPKAKHDEPAIVLKDSRGNDCIRNDGLGEHVTAAPLPGQKRRVSANEALVLKRMRLV